MHIAYHLARWLGHVRISIKTDICGQLSSMQNEGAELIDGLVSPTEVKHCDPIIIR